MAFPPRPKRAPAALDAGEPHFAGSPRMPTPPVAVRPVGDDDDRTVPLRFPGDGRREVHAPAMPRLTLSAADRLVGSVGSWGAPAPTGTKRRPGMLSVMGFTVLLVLAAIGAATVYQGLATYLPLPALH